MISTFGLLLISGIFFLTAMTNAQENNYITSRYDFIPGEKVIFFDDFTSENIGDFPAQWLTNGSGEIVTSQKFPGRWFNITKMGYYVPEAKEDFSDNFRIASGLPDMRNKLLKDGKIISYGIQFDVNSDKLRPESYSTLKEISDILKENPDIKILIIGHTDSDGDNASNLDLSKRRGASVKNELVNKFGADTANPAASSKKKFGKKETGSIKDPRNGKAYKIIKIGTQTWMAENLAFKTDSGCFVYDDPL